MIKHGRRGNPGESPGIDHIAATLIAPEVGSVAINYIDYSATQIDVGDIADLDGFLDTPLPSWVAVRWINVSNTHPYVINQFRRHFEFHTLTAEDVLHLNQRPRVEAFDDHLFVVLRMLRVLHHESEDESVNDWSLDAEQVSIFLYDKVLITFQEKVGDVWQPIRDRLQTESLRIRKNEPGYLLYAMLDAVVDHCFPVLERYGDQLEDLEVVTLETPSPEVLRRIHCVKRELALLRRIIWPMRELVDHLYRDESGRISESTRPYLRDVYEHTIQIVEIIESYREMASGLTDLYMSAVSNRMNEIMKVLTIMSTVFIPLTFIAGVYGMNFHFMPELSARWGYPAVWGVFVILTIGMVLFFRRKGWVGKS
ncbi:magnesium/cobalt transporter CorA [Zhongshania sp. BJYM1]|uniref:magnesium/cobalt transporter CorA n=1 Tax=Zhongshania aquatica TaxID=2965069 RepID=UPI0022B35A1C|nr:magnesium/cobalt transporter CorA [Marortus sp. BJYM1]